MVFFLFFKMLIFLQLPIFLAVQIAGSNTTYDEGKRGSELTMALWSKTGKKHRQNSHSIIHCPTSERVSEVSAAEGASKASSPEQANE